MTVVNHVGLCVADLDRARRFYEGALGFTHARDLVVPDEAAAQLLDVEPPVGLTAAYLEREGFVLELLHFDRPGGGPPRPRPVTEPGLTHLSISVDDLEATSAAVRAHGGEVLDDRSLPGMAVMVRDPDGQLLELLPMSYRTGR